MRIGFQGQLGDVYSDVVALAQNAPGMIGDLRVIVDKIGPHMGTVRHVMEDPALGAVIARVETIRSMEPPSSSAGGAPVGIGLHRLLGPLDAYIWVRRNPWVPWAVGLGAVILVARALRKKGS